MREVVKLLCAWWGGHFEIRGKGIPGSDIICPAQFPWAVEVKNTKDINFKHLLFPNAALKKHWKQTLDQAKKESKRPLLVAKVQSVWMFGEDPNDTYYNPHSSAFDPLIDTNTTIWTTYEGFIYKYQKDLVLNDVFGHRNP